MIPETDPTIALRFTAAAGSYDRNAAIQRAAADDLMSLAPTHPLDCILEIGCGTGLLTDRIASRHPETPIDAIDPSPGMLRLAQSRLNHRPNIHWRRAGLMEWTAPTLYPLVMSNAALHWVHPLDQGIRKIRRLCRPGADVVCSMMLAGTLSELHEARRLAVPSVPPRRELPASETVDDALRRAGFRVLHSRVVTRTAAYPSARHVLAAIHAMGLTGGGLSRGHRPLTRGELHRLADAYDRRFTRIDGSVPATYRILFFHARTDAGHPTC